MFWKTLGDIFVNYAKGKVAQKTTDRLGGAKEVAAGMGGMMSGENSPADFDRHMERVAAGMDKFRGGS